MTNLIGKARRPQTSLSIQPPDFDPQVLNLIQDLTSLRLCFIFAQFYTLGTIDKTNSNTKETMEILKWRALELDP